MSKYSDQDIIHSWKKNVAPWVKAVREGEIASRRLVTNQAIVEVILQHQPKSVLDLGCGEGWLVRELEQSGVTSWGVDVIPEFIAVAQQAGIGRFANIAYENLIPALGHEKFDVVVSNFSLLGKESVDHLFQQIPLFFEAKGYFIVQTLHPKFCAEEKYENGWRAGSWKGFSEKFCDPAPWYFRTLATWKTLFLEHGFAIDKIREPLNPQTQKPASVILVGEWLG